jgi:hypothetical protein
MKPLFSFKIVRKKRPFPNEIIAVKRLFSYLLLALVACLAASPALADTPTNSQTLAVTPLTIDIAGSYAPGSLINSPTIKLTNLSGADVQIKVQTKDFVAGGEHGEPKVVSPGDPGYVKALSLATYLRPSSDNFVIPAGKNTEFHFQIAVPSGAEPGGHYGVVQFVASNVSSDQPVRAQNSVGTLVLFRVAGKVTESGHVASLKAFMERANKTLKQVHLVDPMDHKPILIESRFYNTGNDHYKPTGTVKISNLVGGSTELKLDPQTVLPHSIRAQTVQWSGLPFFAIARVSVHYSYGALSKHSAVGDPYYIVIFPWKLGLLILVIIIFFFIRDKRRERRFRRLVDNSKSPSKAELG